MQRLNDLPLNKLRPEFISQTTELREFLFSYSKPKQIHGKEISGAVLAGLATEYTNAINGGAVPNIESAWTYVCSAQKEKLKKDLLIEFENQLEEEIESKLPLENKNLENILKSFKKKIKLKFEKNCLDKISQQEKQELKKELQIIENNLKSHNQKMLEDMGEQHLLREFQESVGVKIKEFHDAKQKMKSSSEIHDEEENKEWLEQEVKGWKVLQKYFKDFIYSNKNNFINQKDLFYEFLYK